MRASVDRLLQRALRAELRRVLAWVLSGALVAAGTAAVGSPPMGIVIGAVAALFALWSVRQAGTLVLARRDGRGSDRFRSRPRRGDLRSVSGRLIVSSMHRTVSCSGSG